MCEWYDLKRCEESQNEEIAAYFYTAIQTKIADQKKLLKNSPHGDERGTFLNKRP